MLDDSQIVREYYDRNTENEYARIDGRPEFLLTMRFMKRWIRPGDTVLDVGGGPGRYSHALAAYGAKPTLIDLSGENVRFAMHKAEELGLSLPAMRGDAREADKLVDGTYDHVLLMGPMYHLLEEADRVRAVEACLKKLKPGGTLWASFITMFSGVIFMMKNLPEMITSDDPVEVEFRKAVLDGKRFAGDAFTRAIFVNPEDIAPFMARFPLDKLHLFAQEGILSPCEEKVMGASAPAREAWLDFAEALAERPSLYNWTEHLMYVGRKRDITET